MTTVRHICHFCERRWEITDMVVHKRSDSQIVHICWDCDWQMEEKAKRRAAALQFEDDLAKALAGVKAG